MYNLTKARLIAKLQTIGIFLCLLSILLLVVFIAHMGVDIWFYIRSII